MATTIERSRVDSRRSMEDSFERERHENIVVEPVRAVVVEETIRERPDGRTTGERLIPDPREDTHEHCIVKDLDRNRKYSRYCARNRIIRDKRRDDRYIDYKAIDVRLSNEIIVHSGDHERWEHYNRRAT